MFLKKKTILFLIYIGIHFLSDKGIIGICVKVSAYDIGELHFKNMTFFKAFIKHKSFISEV